MLAPAALGASRLFQHLGDVAILVGPFTPPR